MRRYVVLYSDFVRAGIALQLLAVVRVQTMSKISYNFRFSENVPIRNAFSFENVHISFVTS